MRRPGDPMKAAGLYEAGTSKVEQSMPSVPQTARATIEPDAELFEHSAMSGFAASA
jgi:hypothetical protein